LIGNKIDLEDKRKLNKEVAIKFKNDYNLDLFMEASAKSGFNAKNVKYFIFIRNKFQIFIEAAKILYNDYIKYKDKIESTTVSNNIYYKF
jgi:hypothetical protein